MLTQDALLQPLLKLLAQGITDIPALCEQLATTTEHLQTVMNSTALARHLQLQMQLAQAAMKLKVLQLLPVAVQTLEASVHSDKPEVARRSAINLFHLNNISTSSPKPEFIPRLTPQEAAERSEEEQRQGSIAMAGFVLLTNAYINYFHGRKTQNVLPDTLVIQTVEDLEKEHPGIFPLNPVA